MASALLLVKSGFGAHALLSVLVPISKESLNFPLGPVEKSTGVG